MTIPDEAVQAMPERIYASAPSSKGCVVSFDIPSLAYDIEYVRADLAAPFLQGVKVKALEWKRLRVDMTYVTSDDRGMLYYINQSFGSDSYYFATVRYSDVSTLYDGEDLDAAKAAAQADYSARILSAIEVSALEPSPRAQALEEIISELKEAERKIFSWSGSAFVANELEGAEDADCKSEIYNDLCKLGNVMSWLQTQVSALSSQPVAEQSAAERDVLSERRRQVEAEGWTPEHDDNHANGEMARAASCYITAKERTHLPTVPLKWPWSDAWWKPDGYRRNLVKAGALILAEIDRLDRLPASPGASE